MNRFTNEKRIWTTAIAMILTVSFILPVVTLQPVFGDNQENVNGAAVSAATSIPVTGLQITPGSQTVNLGDTFTFTANVFPADATNQTVTWQSSDPNVFKVLKGTVTAHGVGTATLTATTQDGGFQDTATVTVVNPGSVSVTGLSISPSAQTVNLGGTFTFTADVLPTNATKQTVTWQSSNPNVFKVLKGTVTAHGVGTATLTATTQDGSFQDTATVTVVNPGSVSVTGLSISPSAQTVNLGTPLPLQRMFCLPTPPTRL